MKRKVMIARFPGNHHEDPDTVSWLMQTLKEMVRDPRIGEENVHMFCKSDTPIDMVRNECMEVAKRRHIDYVLLIDNDMKPDQPRRGAVPFWSTAFEFLINNPAPAIIAAPYVGPKPHNNSYIFRWGNRNNYEEQNFYLRQFTREESAERTGIEKVAALPTGLMLMDMRILEKMTPPYFYYEWEDPPYNTKKGSTEDVTFTRDASAAWWDVPHAGCYVNWDAWAIHIKRTYCEAPELPHIDALGHARARAEQINSRSNLKMLNVGGGVTLDPRFPEPIIVLDGAHRSDGTDGCGVIVTTDYGDSWTLPVADIPVPIAQEIQDGSSDY